jgi:predicted HTH domain antitoxin
MTVPIELPEEIARQLEASWRNVPRRALEAVALEGYRSGALTRGQAGQLLGLDFWEVEAFLKERQALLPYGHADLEADRTDLARAETE